MPSRLDDKLLTGYLLGELTEAQQSRVEEQLFSDHACLERLQALKAEITDQYVRNRLSPEQGDVFARRFLTTESGREDVLFARTLDDLLRKEAKQPKTAAHKLPVSWWQPVATFFRSASGQQPVMAAAMVVLMIGIGWLVIERQRLTQHLQTVTGERDVAQIETRRKAQLEEEMGRVNSLNQELDQELQKARKDLEQARQDFEILSRQSKESSAVGTILSLVLAPGARRSDEQVDNLVMVPQARTVKLQLLLEPTETGTGYRVEIRTKAGVLIHSQYPLRARRMAGGKALVLNIPSDRLKDGQYEANIYVNTPAGGSEIIHSYDFSVSSR